MTITSVAQWSTDQAQNTDIAGNNIDEGCSPAGINNAIRYVMAQAKAQFDTIGIFDFDTVALLIADTARTYSNTTAGDYIRTRAEGFSYLVAASGASDHDVATGGGLKLYISDAVVTPEHIGTIGGGADDDAIMTKFFALLVKGRKGVARGAYTLDSGIAVTATANMHLDFEGATFTSVAASSISEMLYLEMDDFVLVAEMGTWNADQNTVKCVQIRNSSTGKPDLWIGGTFQNPKLKSTSPLVAANGIFMAGSFDKIHAEKVFV